jgi:hypothetical protein
MEANKASLFFFTGLCSYLEKNGILRKDEFAEHLLGMLDEPRLSLADGDKETIKKSINFLLPIRVV